MTSIIVASLRSDEGGPALGQCGRGFTQLEIHMPLGESVLETLTQAPAGLSESELVDRLGGDPLDIRVALKTLWRTGQIRGNPTGRWRLADGRAARAGATEAGGARASQPSEVRP